MISQVRGAMKGFLMWVFVVLLILAFAFFGVPNLDSLGSSSAIKVGDQSFSQNYIQNEFNRAIQQRRNEIGGNFTQEDAIAQGLHTQVIDSLTTRAALDQYADRLGLAIPRESVRDYLQTNEAFFNPATGKFDRFVLESILQRNGITVSDFEDRIAEDLKRTQLIGALATGTSAPLPMVDAFLMREVERRKISYLTVTDDIAGVAAEPTPPDLQKYYDDNPSVFTAPEFRSFDMLVLRRDDFAEGLSVPEEEIRRLYDANKERLYDQPEKRTLYQLTFDTQSEAQAAAAALKQGQSFEAIAAEKGQSLESVTFTDALKRDILDPSVADAAFAEGLGEGDVIDPVNSLFGWTIAQIAGVTEPVTTTYEEVRAEIESEFLANDTRRALLNAIDAVEEERDTGASLESAAEGAGYQVVRVGPIDQYSFAPGGAIVDKIPAEAIVEAFRLEEGDQSEAMELGDGEGYIFVSLTEIIEPALIPFEQVRDEVDQRWRKQEREARIAQTVANIRDSISAGMTLAEAADPYDRAPIEQLIDRRFENEAISGALTEQLFFAAPGDVVTAPAPTGSSQIIAVVDGIDYPTALSNEQRSLYQQYIGYQLDQDLLEAFIEGIRDDYGVELNQAQLETIFGNRL